jgi:hypothetical protein
MVKYNLAKVYKIIDNTTDNIYIGSTCEPTLARRLAGHVAHYKSYLRGKGNYITSFEILKNEDYEIILMADTPCERKDQLHHIESHYIKHNVCVNKNIPNRTQQEYHQINKEKIQEYKKKYYQDNQKEISKIHKKYYQDNQIKICKHRKQKHICSCGGNFTTTHKSEHCHTKMHQQYINNKIEAQYQYCVELYESTQDLPFENQLVKF